MIVFLDIDGVLHPDPSISDQAFCRRHLLWSILLARPNVQIVISSDWRFHHSLAELANFILRDGDPSLKPRFIGMTPELPGARHEYQGRQQECLLWLNNNQPSDCPWLAIDDVAGNFTYGSPHLILVDHRTGLALSDVERVLTRVPIN